METACGSSDRVLLLGPLRVIRNGAELSLPPSRKVRGLLAYLTMVARPVSRSRLCEMFWDAADDPRRELRWCLSKLRQLVDDPPKVRLVADRQNVAIDLSSLHVDAVRIGRLMQSLPAAATPEHLMALRSQFRGEFLEGLSLDGAPLFDNWLAGERHRFDRLHLELLDRLSTALPAESDERLEVLRRRIDLAPFDEGAHVALVGALLQCALYAEAEKQIAASVAGFQREGFDPTSIKAAFAAEQRATLRQGGANAVLAGPSTAPLAPCRTDSRGPAVLIMPLATAAQDSVADADSVTSDIIFGLAKLRSVSVIARGTAFALRDRPPVAAAAAVNAMYVASGDLRHDGDRYLVRVELSDAASSRIVWVDEFACDVLDSFSVPPILAGQIVAGLDAQIRIQERNRAFLTQPASLEAWQSYHLGLAHMYRFTNGSNLRAQQFFSKAITRDPSFSRSYAGLSFTHFQNAFLFHGREREREASFALEAAGQGVEADPSDPAVHCAMGRALWLRHDHAGAVTALDRSVQLSPNFALAHYALAFVHCQTGDPARALDAAETANRLSPLDPMLFGMHGTRTFALLRLGRLDEAAEYGRRAGGQPNSHVHAYAISALTLAAAGRVEEARNERKRIAALRPDYRFADFEMAFHLMDDLRSIYRGAARIVQIPD
jgi:DNA-binding SARP family transcriptional activator/TolB-like protein